MSRHDRLPALSFAVPLLVLALVSGALAQSDPLPSWREGKTKLAITSFVERVTEEGGGDDRLAIYPQAK